MTTTERMLVAALFGIMMASVTWLLSTVMVNSGRLSVLEQRADNLDREHQELKEDLRDHRRMTERR